jgi:hypothetical protein
MPDREEVSLPLGHEQVICSLFERDFHFGLAALINSLINGGFSGLFWIGCRGELPPWTNQLTRREDGLFQVGDALLGFETVSDHRHFGQYKPEFLSSVIERGIARKYIWYIDPDITVRCDWEFFERWVRYGVCLCQDCALTTMSSRHPFRCEWSDLARAAGWGEPVRQQERYYNSGFVGMDIVHRGFLQTWKGALGLANRNGVDPTHFQKRKRSQLFATIDQDSLNISTMYSEVPLTTVGPEEMGFAYGGFAMFHSTGPAKPWRKKFLVNALRGRGPGSADRHFIASVAGPIRPYSSAEMAWLRTSWAAAGVIKRFYRKA